MTDRLEIKTDWEKLDVGPPEERAAFAAIGIRFNDIWLTEAEDAFVKRIRQQVYLSGYRLAEWLAWNWWRLRWEPRRTSLDWAMAHKMSTIGGGYVWPNITIVSDGERVVFEAHGTAAKPQEPLRYITQFVSTLPAAEFEHAIDRFVEQVVGQLLAERVTNTNLAAIWSDLQEERRVPAIAIRRKFEALLGNERRCREGHRTLACRQRRTWSAGHGGAGCRSNQRRETRHRGRCQANGDFGGLRNQSS